ncbi:MAG TPA: hydroxymethylglutaryl-CoA reductase [Gammaproteobacteria bacterium]|nr:hydroxymethylglutaryl-CoA reductase [Gammaproteobacteria bacterium]
MRWHTSEQIATVPMRLVGPLIFNGPEVNAELMIPLATFETPLWPSTHRGAKVCSLSGGIRAVIVDDRMTRSVLLEADNIVDAYEAMLNLQQHREAMQTIISETSRYARLLDMHIQQNGNLLFVRFEFHTGDAAGHNMSTLAADRLLEWILLRFRTLKYVSISGNFCSDKKTSAVNGMLGRGKYVVAEVRVPLAICESYLKTTPEKIVQLNIKKNLIGNIMAGGLRTANAHFANMLLGFYLATGQDAANIVEGSQGMVHAEVRGQDLYFSVTLPHVIVGTVGSGKTYDFVRENLRLLGCLEERIPGDNARRLAIIVAGAVLCGELSLLAAQTRPGELIKSHLKLERRKSGQGEPRA